MKRTYTTLLVIICLILITPEIYSQVAVNNDGSSPNTNAMLDVDVTTNDKGILIPRLTTTERTAMSLAAGDEGLTVYDETTKSYWLWDGTQWKNFETSGGAKHHIGEVFSGGIIFFVDSTGLHGYMASLRDLDGTTGTTWGLSGTDVSNCESFNDGATNQDSIMSAGALLGDAAGMCDTFNAGGHTDWYLPAMRELLMLLNQDAVIDNVLDNDGNPNTSGFYQEPSGSVYQYWSSSEYDASFSFRYDYFSGTYNRTGKTNLCKVRAIRKF